MLESIIAAVIINVFNPTPPSREIAQEEVRPSAINLNAQIQAGYRQVELEAEQRKARQRLGQF